MVTLQGPIICRPATHGKQHAILAAPQISVTKLRLPRSRFWGYRCDYGCKVSIHQLSNKTKKQIIRSSFSSSSDGSGSMAENYSENDEDYVISSVVEAGMLC